MAVELCIIQSCNLQHDM